MTRTDWLALAALVTLVALPLWRLGEMLGQRDYLVARVEYLATENERLRCEP